nr:wound-induced protein 1-like [Tanacetum cinerariifolium]
MQRLLTGAENNVKNSFKFVPHSVDTFGPIVIVEGRDQERGISWIHAWTVDSRGVITQVREYFNTSLVVTRFGTCKGSVVEENKVLRCPSVWESSLSSCVGKSVPGLVLAI